MAQHVGVVWAATESALRAKPAATTAHEAGRTASSQSCQRVSSFSRIVIAAAVGHLFCHESTGCLNRWLAATAAGLRLGQSTVATGHREHYYMNPRRTGCGSKIEPQQNQKHVPQESPAPRLSAGDAVCGIRQHVACSGMGSVAARRIDACCSPLLRDPRCRKRRWTR